MHSGQPGEAFVGLGGRSESVHVSSNVGGFDAEHHAVQRPNHGRQTCSRRGGAPNALTCGERTVGVRSNTEAKASPNANADADDAMRFCSVSMSVAKCHVCSFVWCAVRRHFKADALFAATFAAVV